MKSRKIRRFIRPLEPIPAALLYQNFRYTVYLKSTQCHLIAIN